MTVHVILSPEIISRRNAKKYLSEHLKLPPTVKKIDNEAYFRQEKIQTIDFPEQLSCIGISAFQDCIHLKKIYLPDSLVLMEKAAFAGCKALTSVRFSTSMKNIPDRAFYKCRKLEELHFPEGIQKIGAEAFYFAGISELHIPSTVISIKEKAFFRCSRLTYIKIPETVKRIGTEAFHGCSQLKTLEITHEPAYIGERVVNRSTIIRCVKNSSVDVYCKKNGILTEYVVDK